MDWADLEKRWLPEVKLKARSEMTRMGTEDLVALITPSGFRFIARSELLTRGADDPGIQAFFANPAPAGQVHVFIADGQRHHAQTIDYTARPAN
jgi:predicted methyltransferase